MTGEQTLAEKVRAYCNPAEILRDAMMIATFAGLCDYFANDAIDHPIANLPLGAGMWQGVREYMRRPGDSPSIDRMWYRGLLVTAGAIAAAIGAEKPKTAEEYLGAVVGDVLRFQSTYFVSLFGLNFLLPRSLRKKEENDDDQDRSGESPPNPPELPDSLQRRVFPPSPSRN